MVGMLKILEREDKRLLHLNEFVFEKPRDFSEVKLPFLITILSFFSSKYIVNFESSRQ